jgi:energy-coupling factor transport system permease protein
MDNDAFIEKFNHYQLTGNWFKDLNPINKLNILLVIGLSCFVVDNYIYGLVICVLCYVLAFAMHEVKYFNRIFSKLIIILFLFVIVVRQLSVPGNIVIFSIFGWKWTWEALENGLNIGGKLLAFSGTIVLFFAATPMRDLMYSFEQKGVSHSVSYVMLSSFQTIVDLKASAQVILESQKSRGIETEGSAIHRIKAFLPIISPLLLGAISSTEEKTIAMDARAFSAKTQHTFLRELRPVPTGEKVFTVMVDAYFVATIVFKVYTTFVK